MRIEGVDTKKTWAVGYVVFLSGGVILGCCSSPRMEISYAVLSVFVPILNLFCLHRMLSENNFGGTYIWKNF